MNRDKLTDGLLEQLKIMLGLERYETIPFHEKVIELLGQTSILTDDVSELLEDWPDRKLSIVERLGILIGEPVQPSEEVILSEQEKAISLQRQINKKIIKAQEAGNDDLALVYNGLSSLVLAGSYSKDDDYRRKILSVVRSLIGRLGKSKSGDDE